MFIFFLKHVPSIDSYAFFTLVEGKTLPVLDCPVQMALLIPAVQLIFVCGSCMQTTLENFTRD